MPATLTNIDTGEVHVWQAPLDVPDAVLAELRPLLTPDEEARADRFRFARHRRRFVAGRGFLRRLLSRYTGLDPAALRFSYGPHGKPALSPTNGEADLHFNLSHSADLAVYAVTRARRVGIDVERVRPLDDAERLVQRFFSEAEQEAFARMPPRAREKAFFTGWTRKEAFVKAHGEGLSFPLHAFDVPIDPGAPASLLHTRGDLAEAAQWTLCDVPAPPDFVAALAAEGGGWRLTAHQMPL